MRVVIALLLTAGVVLANGPPPVPPKGKKFVSVTNTLKLDHEVKGYTFFTMPGGPWAAGDTPTEFKIGTDKAVDIPSGKYTALYAVPNDLVSKLKTTEQWLVAIRDAKSGIHEKRFANFAEVDEKDGDRKVEAHVIKGIDAKGMDIERVESKADDKKEPLALAEPGYLIGGIALALSVTFGGVWLVWRRRTG